MVRQLFKESCINSAHWHRFLTTIHSDVGYIPSKYQIKLKVPQFSKEGLFAQYEVGFSEELQIQHDELGVGLRKALYNYMYDIGLSEDIRAWFNLDVPRTKIIKTFIKKALKNTHL